MKDYAALKKNYNGRPAAAAMLAFCVLLSGALLFSRLVGYAPVQRMQYIPLTASSGITRVQTGYRDENGQVQPGSPGDHITMSALPGAPVLEKTDGEESPIWLGLSDLELFHMEYTNETGEVTVSSQNGDQLVAPGTRNEYVFTLQNGGKIALDYTMELEAYFTMDEYAIPLKASMRDYHGDYLLGSESEMADVLDLNNVYVEDSLSAGYIAPYTITWEWPFEGDDEWDTLLGNMATDTEIGVTIIIRTVAEVGNEGGMPDTGDSAPLYGMVAVMLLALAGILLLLLLPRRKKEERDED